MYLEFTQNNQDIATILKGMEQNPNIKSVVMVVADENHPKKAFLDPILKELSKPIIGGIFPQIIVSGKPYKSGCMFLGVNYKLKTLVIDHSNTYAEELQETYNSNIDQDGALLMFVDVLASNKPKLLDDIYNALGINIHYLGAGCGSLSMQSMPCVIHNSGLHKNASAIGLTKSRAEVGIAHGWEPCSKALKITEAEGCVIKTIDWMPAFQVYQKEIFLNTGVTIDKDDFFESSKSFPFGMLRLDDDMIIRDIIQTNGTELFLLDSIDEGEHVRIMKSDMDKLLEGAKKSRILANASNEPDENLFCIDCIPRP